MKKRGFKINAFSLVETLVTLATFGILLSMLSEILILNLQVSRKVTARTVIREDLAEMTGLMQRDMRNASFIHISTCGGDPATDPPVVISGIDYYGCEIEHFQEIKWVLSSDVLNSLCTPNEFNGNKVDAICRLDTNGEVLYKTSNHVDIDSFKIDVTAVESDPSDPDKGTDAIIYFTVVANAANDNWDISNQFRQVVVTTRNY